MAKGKIRVGTSGWLYRHWKGTFYPKGLRAKDEFPYYSLFFNTVELNNPFYRLPSKETFETWRKNSKPDFLFIVKASRYITHMKKLNDTKDALDLFLHNCNGLEEKLGPILFQLPPGWELNIARLETFLKQLPKGYRFAFEFRNRSWYISEVYALLKKYNCAFCIYQLAGHLSPIEVTADWVYLRLHGPTKNKYQGSYDFKTLNTWAERSRQWQEEGKDVYIYFDNDDSGYAAFNAQVIEMMLNKQVPLTEHEAKVLTLVIRAINERKILRFYSESSSGKVFSTMAPYVIAIDAKGDGDIYFSGYQYPGSDSMRKLNKDGGHEGRYLLKDVKLDRFEILEESFEELRIEESRIFGDLDNVRIVYRVPPLKKSAAKHAAKKMPEKKNAPAKKPKKTSKRKNSGKVAFTGSK